MLAEIQTRIDQAAANPFKSVSGAISLAAAQDNPPQKGPAAWVYPSAAAGESSNRVNEHRQKITTRFGVVFFLRSDVDPSGGRKVDAVEAHYTWLRNTLIGWVPDPTTGQAVSFQRGYLAGFEDGGVWWAEEFSVDHYVRTSP